MAGCPCIVCVQTSEVSPRFIYLQFLHFMTSLLTYFLYVKVGVVERLGKYSRLVTPGINFMCCPVEYVADKISLRVQQLNVMCETKTLDNVFVQVQIVVQYKVRADKVFDAYYKLDQPKAQIQAYVFDTVICLFFWCLCRKVSCFAYFSSWRISHTSL